MGIARCSSVGDLGEQAEIWERKISHWLDISVTVRKSAQAGGAMGGRPSSGDGGISQRPASVCHGLDA